MVQCDINQAKCAAEDETDPENGLFMSRNVELNWLQS